MKNVIWLCTESQVKNTDFNRTNVAGWVTYILFSIFHDNFYAWIWL